MKLIRILGITSVAVLTSMAFASIASATTLEVNGVAKSEKTVLLASLKAGSSTIFEDTANSAPPLKTCTASTLQLTTSTSATSGTTVSGSLDKATFENCTQGPVVVDTLGTFNVENIAGTTNGTVNSFGTIATWSTWSLGTLTC